MKLLSIGLSGATGEIRDKIEHDCKALTQEGFRVVIEELKKGNYTFLALNISEGEMSFRNYERIKTVLKNSVSQILADWIINNEEQQLVNKLVANNHCYFSQDERGIVETNALRALNNTLTTRYGLILSRIIDYLDSHHELVVEGFLNFRLKDYRHQLSGVIDKVVDDFMMELEYKEFIRVLRYFVDVQEPRVEEAHVVISGDGIFKIFDSHGKTINNQHLENVMLHSHSLEDEEISYEDLLISALITIAPYNIMVHSTNKPRDQEMLETIKSVFDGRVVLCEGCSMCVTDYAGKSNHTEL